MPPTRDAVTAALFAVQGWTALHLGYLRVCASIEGVVGERRYRAPFFQLLALVDWAGAVLNLVVLGVAFCLPPRAWLDRLVAALERRRFEVAAGVVIAAAILSLTAYHRYPLTMDEYAPVFQAEIFSRGSLVGRWPPEFARLLVAPEYFRGFLITSAVTGEVCSDYRPGHALLLTPFTWCGAAWACNPLLAGLTLWLTGTIAGRVFGRRAAGWAILFTVCSPVFWAYAMSFYAMMAHLACNLLFVLLLLRPSLPRIAAAGAVGGLALQLHNPFPHFLFSLPWIAGIAAGPARFRRLAVLLGCYAAVFVPLECGWTAVETAVRSDRGIVMPGWSAPVVSRSDDSVTEGPGDSGKAPGSFVGGVRALGGEILSPFGMQPLGAVAGARFASFMKGVAWDAPGLVVLACVGAWLTRRLVPARGLAASAILTFLGYTFVTMGGGHGWGHRYFFPAWGCLPLLAAGLRSVDEPRWTRILQRVGLAAVMAFVLILPVRCWQIHGFIRDHRAQLPQIPDAAAASAAEGFVMSFIDPRQGWFRGDLIRNDPFLAKGPYVLVSMGDEIDALVVREFARRAGMTAARVSATPKNTTWIVAPQERLLR
ncbi:MAG: hypothetical protein EBZ59_02985 [Planctomycetia bacterium]|nr:hypothetical protein [Planctomycetia bacterium]